MTPRRRWAAAAPAAVLLAVLTACSDDRPGAASSSSVDPSGSTSSSTVPSQVASPRGTVSAAPPATGDCLVTVARSALQREPRVLYALRFTLAAGARSEEQRDATLYTYPPLSMGVRVFSPTPGRLDRVTEDAVLDATAARGTTLLDGLRGLRWSVANTTGRTARYLAWAGATASTLSWSRTCDGQSSSGTVTLVGPIRNGLVRCGEQSPPAADDARRLLRSAQRIACQQDSTEAAPFRSLEGKAPEGPN